MRVSWANAVPDRGRVLAWDQNRPAVFADARRPVEFIDYLGSREILAGGAVENIKETIAIGVQQQLARAARVRHVHQNRPRLRIPIVGIARRELEVPLQLASVHVERNN